MTPLERELLLVEAARSDEPPAGARERVLAAMGVAAAASTAAAAAGAATKLTAKATLTSTLVKALVVGAALGGGGMVLVSRESPSPPAATPITPSARASAMPSVRTETAAVEATPVPSTQPAPAPRPGERRVGPVGVEAPEVPSTAPAPLRAEQVSAERQLLDGARQALDAGRASTAVKALGDYEQRFGFGVLGHEAVALKVRALLALGRRAEAQQVGERYLREAPHGTQAPTIRRALGLPSAEGPQETPPSDQNSQGRP